MQRQVVLVDILTGFLIEINFLHILAFTILILPQLRRLEHCLLGHLGILVILDKQSIFDFLLEGQHRIPLIAVREVRELALCFLRCCILVPLLIYIYLYGCLRIGEFGVTSFLLGFVLVICVKVYLFLIYVGFLNYFRVSRCICFGFVPLVHIIV